MAYDVPVQTAPGPKRADTDKEPSRHQPAQPTRDALTPAPHLRRQGSATQLVVDGRPFLILGGELHNSSASSLD